MNKQQKTIVALLLSLMLSFNVVIYGQSIENKSIVKIFLQAGISHVGIVEKTGIDGFSFFYIRINSVFDNNKHITNSF